MFRLAAVLALAAAFAAPAATASSGPTPLGEHVSTCAQADLPPADPPAITCSTMTFENFGAMVQHMLAWG